MESTWSKWNDIHILTEQQKRQERAKEKTMTPISIDTENSTGIFKGSSGQYKTSLSECSCRDFILRRFPCKHMYRLAYELGLFELSNVATVSLDANNRPISPLNKVEAFEKVRAVLTQDEQKTFAYFCYLCKNNQLGEQLVSEPLASKLIANELAEEVTDIQILLKYMRMNDIKKILPAGIRSPRTKVELIALVAPFAKKEDIFFPENQKCLTLHSSIAHLGHTLHKRLNAVLPHTDFLIL